MTYFAQRKNSSIRRASPVTPKPRTKRIISARLDEQLKWSGDEEKIEPKIATFSTPNILRSSDNTPKLPDKIEPISDKISKHRKSFQNSDLFTFFDQSIHLPTFEFDEEILVEIPKPKIDRNFDLAPIRDVKPEPVNQVNETVYHENETYQLPNSEITKEISKSSEIPVDEELSKNEEKNDSKESLEVSDQNDDPPVSIASIVLHPRSNSFRSEKSTKAPDSIET